MFIVIKKIVTRYKRDSDGRAIKSPITSKQEVDGVKIVEETIRIDEVKSSREYHNPKMYKSNGVEGDVTVLYMAKSNSSDSRMPEIHINENIDSWNNRIGAVKLV